MNTGFAAFYSDQWQDLDQIQVYQLTKQTSFVWDMRSVFQRWESSEVSTREKPKAANLRTTAEYLMNEVYTRIVELATPEQILDADLQNHSACFSEYMHKCR